MPDGDSTATSAPRHGRGGRPEADLALLGLAAVMSVATYVGAALSLIGAVPRRLPLWRTVLSQLASSDVVLVGSQVLDRARAHAGAREPAVAGEHLVWRAGAEAQVEAVGQCRRLGCGHEGEQEPVGRAQEVAAVCLEVEEEPEVRFVEVPARPRITDPQVQVLQPHGGSLPPATAGRRRRHRGQAPRAGPGGR